MLRWLKVCMAEMHQRQQQQSCESSGYKVVWKKINNHHRRILQRPILTSPADSVFMPPSGRCTTAVMKRVWATPYIALTSIIITDCDVLALAAASYKLWYTIERHWCCYLSSWPKISSAAIRRKFVPSLIKLFGHRPYGGSNGFRVTGSITFDHPWKSSPISKCNLTTWFSPPHSYPQNLRRPTCFSFCLK